MSNYNINFAVYLTYDQKSDIFELSVKIEGLRMKIALPVKMNKENSAIAPLFGKAKWFAIVEDGKISMEANNNSGGNAVIEWLAKMGVDTIVMQEMGRNPYSKIKSYGNIEVYHAGFERTLLNDVLEKLEKKTLIKVDDDNMEAIIQHHEKRHPAH
jgi:predicted Fe-Mo cluster-binding NifX family protein